MSSPESRLFYYGPDTGGSEYGSIVAPYIGAAFEGSRILKKVRDIRTGLAEVPVYKVEDSDERQMWAFRNIHAYSEYTSPLTVHWKMAVDDWVLDIRTATSSGKLDPADPDGKKRIPLDRTERQGAVESEKLMKAMIAVTASSRAMETSAGSMDAYVAALVGDNLDRADGWKEFLIHGGRDKIEMLLGKEGGEGKGSGVIRYYYDKLVEDADTMLNSQLFDFLKKIDKVDYKGGFREYVYEFLLEEESSETEDALIIDGLIPDDEVRTAAAKLAADIFLVDKYTEWEKKVEDQYIEKNKNNPDPKLRRVQIKPTENWGGNPLRAIIEPSFLPKTIKGIYARDKQIWELLDEAFTFKVARETNRGVIEVEGRVIKSFDENYTLRPTMTTPLKALSRYGQALMAFLGGSTAPSIAAWGKDQLDGKAGIPTIITLMNQVVGDVEGMGDKEDQWPFGKDAMGRFTAEILHLKALASVRQFVQPTSFELVFSQDDKRNLKEIAHYIFGSTLDFKSGLIQETSSAALGFAYKFNRIPGVAEMIYDTKNLLLLGGETTEGEAQLKKSLMIALGIAVILGSGGGGGGKSGKRR